MGHPGVGHLSLGLGLVLDAEEGRAVGSGVWTVAAGGAQRQFFPDASPILPRFVSVCVHVCMCVWSPVRGKAQEQQGLALARLPSSPVSVAGRRAHVAVCWRPGHGDMGSSVGNAAGAPAKRELPLKVPALVRPGERVLSLSAASTRHNPSSPLFAASRTRGRGFAGIHCHPRCPSLGTGWQLGPHPA